MRIVCLGDSLTWGKYGGSYVDTLGKLKREHTFINAGVGGDTVVNLLRRLDEDVLAHGPDAVFVMIGCNDAISSLYPKTRPYYQQVKKIPNGHLSADDFGNAYRELLQRLQLSHCLVWIGLEPAEYSLALDAQLRVFNDRARAAAKTLNLPVLDLHSLMLPPRLRERPPLGLDALQLIGRRTRDGWRDYEAERVLGGYTFTFDGLHPTPEGAEQIAKHVAAFISS